MCDPVIAGGAMLAMSGIQAYTQYQQGKYASKVAEANADIATAQANDAINRGNAEAEKRRRETRQRLGTQAATMGLPALIYLQVTRWIYLATLPSLALLIR